MKAAPTDRLPGTMSEEREFGPQPLIAVMERWSLESHDLVEASDEQLTHKQVQRARSGRKLTLKMTMKVARSLNLAIWSRLDAPSREKFVEYFHRDLCGYFLQFHLRAMRKDRDGWATESSLLGDRIRAARKKLGLTLLQLAKRVGVTKGTLITWEANRHQPSGNTVRKLTELLGSELVSAHDQRRKA